MTRRSTYLSRLVLAPVLVALLALGAFASDASDAYKQAKAKADTVAKMEEGPARDTAKQQLEEFARSKGSSLASGTLSKMDLMYVGLLYQEAGLKSEAVDALKKAVDDAGKTQYGATIHAYYVEALLAAEKHREAFEEFEKMAAQYEGDKSVKKEAMTVGIALRGARMFDKSAAALGVALANRNPAALKPLVNSLLMVHKKDEAIAAIKSAIELAGDAGAKDEHDILLAITQKVGTKIPLEFAAFVPEAAPTLEGKVVVVGYWNVSAVSLNWTMQMLESIRKGWPEDVVTLAATTYYQKDPESGKIDEAMTAEAEHELGRGFMRGYEGIVAYAKTPDVLQSHGLSGLPYFNVFGRDGTLIFSHTMDRSETSADVEILRSVLEKAVAK